MTAKQTTASGSTERLSPSFFTLRGLILAAVMLAVYTVLTRYSLNGMNTYATAYQARIEFYSDRIDSLSKIGTWKQRLFLRHVGNYEIPQWIAANRTLTDTILLPPLEYAATYLQVDPTWTDPRIFTYFAGFQPIVAYTDTHRWSSVNTWVALEPGAIRLVRADGTFNVDSLLQVYATAAASKHERGLP